MNRSWGNVAADPLRKPASELLTMLTEVAAGGGNLLLNVSPDADGVVPAWQLERLDALGEWLARHGAAVFDTRAGPRTVAVPRTDDEGGRDAVYLFCPYQPVDAVVVRGVPTRRVESVRALGAGVELAHRERVSAIDEVFNSDPIGDLVIEVPASVVDPLCTVIEVRSSPTARLIGRGARRRSVVGGRRREPCPAAQAVLGAGRSGELAAGAGLEGRWSGPVVVAAAAGPRRRGGSVPPAVRATTRRFLPARLAA